MGLTRCIVYGAGSTHRHRDKMVTCLMGGPLLWGGGGKAGMWLMPSAGKDPKPAAMLGAQPGTACHGCSELMLD